MAKNQHLRLHAEAQQVGLEVDAALVAAQHVQAKQEVRALLHDGDAHGQVLRANLGVHLRSRCSHHIPDVCMATEIPHPRRSSSLLMMVVLRVDAASLSWRLFKQERRMADTQDS